MGIRIDGASDLINATDGSLTIEGQSINSTGVGTFSGGVKVGSAATIHSTGQFNIGVAATVFPNGNATFAGIVTTAQLGGDVLIEDKIVHAGDTNTAIRFPSADTISFEAGGEEHCRVLETGNLLVGATAVEDWDGSRGHRLQVRGTSSNNSGISILATQNDDNPCELVLGKSRSTGNTIVGSADDIGQIRFAANDGAGFHSVAWIRSTMDGTPGSDDLPSNLRFGTSADGGATVSERLRIDSGGDVQIGATAPITTYSSGGNKLSVYKADGNGGILELGGSTNSNGYNGGQIIFYNNANANNSAWQSDSKLVGIIRAETITTDSNAGDDSGADITFYTKPEADAGGLAMTIHGEGNVSIDDGNLVVASGHGIDFAATGGPDSGASGSSELLDDYEEGSWSGVVMDGSSTNISINNVVARYVKIGQYVHCYFNITRNETSSRSGTVQFWQLPFTALNSTMQVCGTFWLDEGGTTSGDSVGGAIYIHSNTNNAQFVHPTTDAQQSANRYLQYSEWSQHRPIYGSFSYMTQD